MSTPTCQVSSQSAIPTVLQKATFHRCMSLVFTLIICNCKQGKQTCLWCSQEHESPSLTKWWVRSRWEEQCKGVCNLDGLSAVHRPVASPSFPQATGVGWALNGVIGSSTLCFSCISLASAQWLHEISYFIITHRLSKNFLMAPRHPYLLSSSSSSAKHKLSSLAQNWTL